MGTMIEREASTRKLLENLTRYEYDVVEAYRAATERVSLLRETEMLASFGDEHLEQIRNLVGLSQTMGGKIVRAGDWRQLLTEGKVVVAGLVSELAVLTATTHNERKVLNAYERAASRSDVPEEVRAVLALHRNRAQRRHKWLTERVEQLTL